MSTGKDLFQYVTTCDLRKVNKFLQSYNTSDIINYQNNVKEFFLYFLYLLYLIFYYLEW